jgi:hypothetical protein
MGRQPRETVLSGLAGQRSPAATVGGSTPQDNADPCVRPTTADRPPRALSLPIS